MRVERLELSGVGPFEDAVFDFGPAPEGDGELVLFEGPNGSGKTTVLEVLAVIVGKVIGDDIVGDPSSEELFDEKLGHATRLAFDRIQDRRCGNDPHVFAKVSHLGGEAKLELLPAFTGFEQLPTAFESKASRWAGFAYRPHLPTPWVGRSRAAWSKRALHGATGFGDFGRVTPGLGELLLKLELSRVQAESYAAKEDDPAKKKELVASASRSQDALARFESAFSSLLGRRVTIEFRFGEAEPILLFDGDRVPLEYLGEGLRSTVSWLSDLLIRLENVVWRDAVRPPFDQAFWLILDEIDEGLHPELQGRLLPAIQQLFPRARIYASTHSPFVVASATKGIVFPIRPDKQHRVRGEVAHQPLGPGQTLAYVTDTIFDTESRFVDVESRKLLEKHQTEIDKLRVGGGESIDWDAFLADRRRLMGLNDEVQTAVVLQEVPVREHVREHLKKRAPEAGK